MIQIEKLKLLLKKHKKQENFDPLKTIQGEEVTSLKPPNWLIEDFIMEEGFTVLHSDAGVGKTFLALDWANTIANGWSWFGRETNKTTVLYVLAEGIGYLGARVSAWKNKRNASIFPPVFYYTSAVPLFAPIGKMPTTEQLDFLELVERIDPGLIVFDTLQRCTVGANENLQQDMGQVISMVDTLRQNFNCAILAVHHDTKSGESMRGSSVIRASADTTIQLASKGESFIEMTCTKQKDAEPFKEWSMVISADEDSGSAYLTAYQQGVKARDYTILKALGDITTHRGEKFFNKAWREAANLEGGKFERPKAQLIRDGLVGQEGEGRSKSFFVTKEGWDILEQEALRPGFEQVQGQLLEEDE
jgi:RecA-family ATPase|tara:strand:+ start:75 stop:1157 length:1083 start_codon:yes stop_codon:yes gene_type:complete